MTTTMDWTAHNGGDCPVDEKAIVDLQLRSGRVIERTVAGRWLWNRPCREASGLYVPSTYENGGMVVAYRELGEAA
ncbi:hypothetical protein [Rhizobium leucaenae]|uniref:hypothetical protein n=1 Tax=Rhizobium leucaenae TaxID=29450 RepID=UPI0007EE799F|nr:hypothetical protein [Rhizobium leucaenae]